MDLAEFQKKPIYPVVYMFVVMFCLTTVLVAFARNAADRVEANKRILFERAVLEAVGAEFDASSPAAIHAAFVASISAPTPESRGAYVYAGRGPSGSAQDRQNALATGSSTGVPPVAAYALPFEGKGFWNVIRGVIGIKSDGRTVTGIAFHEQSETPGLGAEIVKPRFRDQFKALVLVEGPVPLPLQPGGSDKDKSGVEAITGATQTCTRLEKMLNNALKRWRSEL